MAIGMSVEAIRIGPQFDPLGDDYLADPYPFMAEARDAAPVFYSQKLDHWIVTRYPLIRQVFLNPQIFSAANANAPLRPACPAAVKALEEGGFRAVPTLANVDPPAHTRVRRMANGAFTPARVSAMEDFIRDLVVRYCDERFRDEHADIVRDLAWELPVRVLFKILGIDEDRVAEIKEGSFNRILFVYGRTGSEAEQVRAAAGMATFWRYAEQLVAARTREPRDDFTSAIVLAADERGERLSSQQAATVVLNLLFAGHETTTGILGNCLRRLLADRAAWDAICVDSSLIPNAVEEVLRLDSSVIAWRRRATQDTALAEVSIPAGANLVLLLGSGNRDPVVFPDPDRFDIRRPNAKDHLSFGHGVHLCLGRGLARLQARIVLEELSSRFPTLRLAPDVTLEFAPNISFRGPLSLPVVWNDKSPRRADTRSESRLGPCSD
jgi:cytochrome P450